MLVRRWKKMLLFLKVLATQIINDRDRSPERAQTASASVCYPYLLFLLFGSACHHGHREETSARVCSRRAVPCYFVPFLQVTTPPIGGGKQKITQESPFSQEPTKSETGGSQGFAGHPLAEHVVPGSVRGPASKYEVKSDEKDL